MTWAQCGISFRPIGQLSAVGDPGEPRKLSRWPTLASRANSAVGRPWRAAQIQPLAKCGISFRPIGQVSAVGDMTRGVNPCTIVRGDAGCRCSCLSSSMFSVTVYIVARDSGVRQARDQNVHFCRFPPAAARSSCRRWILECWHSQGCFSMQATSCSKRRSCGWTALASCTGPLGSSATSSIGKGTGWGLLSSTPGSSILLCSPMGGVVGRRASQGVLKGRPRFQWTRSQPLAAFDTYCEAAPMSRRLSFRSGGGSLAEAPHATACKNQEYEQVSKQV